MITTKSNKEQSMKTPGRRPRLVSLQEAAKYWGVSERTMRRYISNGLIAGHRIGPKLIRIDLNELDDKTGNIQTGNEDPDIGGTK